MLNSAFPKEGHFFNPFQFNNMTWSVESLLKRFATSKLTIHNERMSGSLTLSSKWVGSSDILKN